MKRSFALVALLMLAAVAAMLIGDGGGTVWPV
jgi:hypothetical protein